jgi:hypothetical protein
VNEGAAHMLLPHHLVESCRTVFARQDFVAHG